MDIAEQMLQLPAEAFAKAREMLEIMNADMEERDIAKRVREYDGGDTDMQLATWECLTTKERNAWRKYWLMGRP